MLDLISILCPTRQRPHRCAEMIISALQRASRSSQIEFRLLVDHDDPDLPLYRQLQSHQVFLTVQEPRLSNPAAMNRLATEISLGDVLIACSDDILFRTEGWDDVLLAAFAGCADRLLFAFFNDGPSAKFPEGRDKAEHFAVSRRWVETVGYFMHPSYEHFCADEHVERIARAVDRRLWLRNVTLEHMHFKYMKAAHDTTYARTRQADAAGKSMSQRDNERLAAFAADGEISRATARVRAAIDDYARKAA